MSITERNIQSPMADGLAGPSEEGAEAQNAVSHEAANWIRLARDAFTGSDEYWETNLRKQWERNYYMWRSQHPPGSKYSSDQFKHRSKAFRPKTRSTILREEAKAAAAFFSTDDVVSLSPTNDNDKAQRASAAFWEEAIKYRLKTNDKVNWFLVLMGAYQTSRITGITVATAYWDYEERIKRIPLRDEAGAEILDQAGNPVEIEQIEVIKDHPIISLRPPENIRIDPAADWANPVNSSPFLIDMVPIYVHEARDKIQYAGHDPKTGMPEWRHLTDGEISSAITHEYDSTRQSREGQNRNDSKDTSSPISDFDIVWVHKNFIRHGGEDWYYETLGTEHLLTEPKPVSEVFLHGVRPYVIGYTALEAFRPIPSGLPEITEGLQNLANSHANLRIDNVNLALLRRYIVERNHNTDVGTLTSGIPGGVTMTDKLGGVKELAFNDVTASAYEEQNRINLDYDELSGVFSGASVATNRSLNETVGGMQILSNDANQVNEYTLRIFSETFVRPLLWQFLLLMQRYETDATVMALAAEQAKLVQRFGVDQITNDLLNARLTLQVNVGIGATNPTARLEKLMLALEKIGKVKPQLLQKLDDEELVVEVFGTLGYQDGKRFFPMMRDEQTANTFAQYEQTIKQLTQIIEQKKVEEQAKNQSAERVAQIRAQADLAIEQLRQNGAAAGQKEKSNAEMRVTRIESILEREKLAQKDKVDMAKIMVERARLGLDQLSKKHEEDRLAFDKERDMMDRNGTPDIVEGRAQIAQAFKELAKASAIAEDMQNSLDAQVAEMDRRVSNETEHIDVVINALAEINAKIDAELAPKEIERDKEGKIVRVGQREVLRDTRGRVVGLGEMPEPPIGDKQIEDVLREFGDKTVLSKKLETVNKRVATEAEHVDALIEELAAVRKRLDEELAPKDVVRGPDGRIVRIGGRAVKRDDSGKVTGVGGANDVA